MQRVRRLALGHAAGVSELSGGRDSALKPLRRCTLISGRSPHLEKILGLRRAPVTSFFPSCVFGEWEVSAQASVHPAARSSQNSHGAARERVATRPVTFKEAASR